MVGPCGDAKSLKRSQDTYRSGELVYKSTIDSIKDLYAKYSYYVSAKQLPVVILIHGFVQDASAISDAIMEDMAGYGFFAVAVGMRGRNGASGIPDVSGRELHDVYDLVNCVKREFAGVVDADNVHCSGYSGGGGNVFGLAAKFPDTFRNLAAHFGIADYGYDPDIGWWHTHPTRQATLKRWIGYTPEENPGAYMSRAHQLGIGRNLLGGKLWIFHDSQDASVPVSHSDCVAAKMDSASNSNYFLSITDVDGKVRWLHNSPHADAPARHTRDYWGASILNNAVPSWIVPKKGDMLVQGYLVTKRFQVWLGNGQEHVAELTYDIEAGNYTLSPLTGQVEVSITQGGKSATQAISGKTTIVVS